MEVVQLVLIIQPKVIQIIFSLIWSFVYNLCSFLLKLLEQMEGSGPPPAEPDKIAGLPTVKIVQNDIG